MYTLQSAYFLQKFIANSNYLTSSSSLLNYANLREYSPPGSDPSTLHKNSFGLQNNSNTNFSALELPDLYYFGISVKLMPRVTLLVDPKESARNGQTQAPLVTAGFRHHSTSHWPFCETSQTPRAQIILQST